MRRLFACLALFSLAGNVTADDLVNGGFEETIQPWTMTSGDDGEPPFASASVGLATEYALPGHLVHTATEGETFALLSAQTSNSPGSQGNRGHDAYASLAQRITVRQFDFITGDFFAALSKADPVDPGSGPVSVADLVIQVSRPTGGLSVSLVPTRAGEETNEMIVPWSRFHFMFPEAGTYDVTFSVEAYTDPGDAGFADAVAGIDNVRIRAPLAGDTDADGDIDIVDLNNVRNHFGEGVILGPPAAGEAYPFNGLVDVGDLNLVRNAFGTSIVDAVPEPSSIALFAIAIAAGISWHAQRFARPPAAC